MRASLSSLLYKFFQQTRDFAGVGVPSGCHFGVQNFTVHQHLKPPAVAGKQGDGLNLFLKVVQQLGRQTGGTGSVVSIGAVGDRDGEHENDYNMPGNEACSAPTCLEWLSYLHSQIASTSPPLQAHFLRPDGPEARNYLRDFTHQKCTKSLGHSRYTLIGRPVYPLRLNPLIVHP